MEIATSGGYYEAVLVFKVGGVSEFWGHLQGRNAITRVWEFTGHSVSTLYNDEEEAGSMAAQDPTRGNINLQRTMRGEC